MKRRISFLLSIFMLMQLLIYLPVMAEDSSADTNMMEAVVGNSFMYADENISCVQIDDSEGNWYEAKSLSTEYRWAVYYKTTLEDPVYGVVMDCNNWQTIIAVPYVTESRPSIQIEVAGGYAFVIMDNDYYVMSSKAVSGYNLIPQDINYIIDDGYIVSEEREMEEIISSYYNIVFVNASDDEVEEVISYPEYNVALCTQQGTTKIFGIGQTTILISENGDKYISTNRVPREIEVSEIETETESEMAPDTKPETEDVTEPETEIDLHTLCVGYEFLLPDKVEEVYVGGQDDLIDYTDEDDRILEYIEKFASLPYYRVEGSHPIINEVMDDPFVTYVYFKYPDNTVSMQAYVEDKYIAMYGGKWYVGATDVISGYYLFDTYAKSVQTQTNTYTGIEEVQAFFDKYDAYCFEEVGILSVQDIITEGVETVINYYYVESAYIYVYEDKMVVIDYNGVCYRLVYANGQYIGNSTGSEPETEPETEFDTEPETEAEIESESETETEPETELETEAETEPEIESESETETELETELETEAVTEPEIESESETETEPETELETEAETEAEIESDIESETASGTEPETEPDDESGTVPGTEPDIEPDTKPVIRPTPVGKKFSFKRPMPIFLAMPEPEPVEHLFVRPPFAKNRFFNVKFNEFITWIRRVSN